MLKDKLLDEEIMIENEIDFLKPVSGTKKDKIKNILAQAKKNRSISLRISSFDLENRPLHLYTHGNQVHNFL